jgi:hypothetical protein
VTRRDEQIGPPCVIDERCRVGRLGPLDHLGPPRPEEAGGLDGGVVGPAQTVLGVDRGVAVGLPVARVVPEARAAARPKEACERTSRRSISPRIEQLPGGKVNGPLVASTRPVRR